MNTPNQMKVCGLVVLAFFALASCKKDKSNPEDPWKGLQSGQCRVSQWSWTVVKRPVSYNSNGSIAKFGDFAYSYSGSKVTISDPVVSKMVYELSLGANGHPAEVIIKKSDSGVPETKIVCLYNSDNTLKKSYEYDYANGKYVLSTLYTYTWTNGDLTRVNEADGSDTARVVFVSQFAYDLAAMDTRRETFEKSFILDPEYISFIPYFGVKSKHLANGYAESGLSTNYYKLSYTFDAKKNPITETNASTDGSYSTTVNYAFECRD